MNKTISKYLNQNILFPRFLERSPQSNLGICVVIPCYNEPEVCGSIWSLSRCVAPHCSVEIIVSINAGENDTEQIKVQNRKSAEALEELSELPDWLSLHVLLNEDLPEKKAGVGLGRKIGMDEAVRRFLIIDKIDGIIVCFDADSLCKQNYFVEIERHFLKHGVESASIDFAHPINGEDFDQEIYHHIAEYELHLRYFVDMQKKIGLPYAFQTIGSSMACTVNAYCAVGGMNQRKAGEDFYFIHKLIKYGRHSELNSTKVIPSPRVSDRVPFGTGRAIGEMIEEGRSEYLTYHPASFSEIGVLVNALPSVFQSGLFDLKLLPATKAFLTSISADQVVDKLKLNATDYQVFEKHFWQWFDAFQLMKYLHFMRANGFADIPVVKAVCSVTGLETEDSKELLLWYRSQIQRSN